MNRLIHQKKIYEAGIHEFQTYSNMDFINPPLQTLVLSNGNVGIGTNVPTSKLDVRGTIVCSNIQVIGDFVTLNTVTSNTEQIVVENAGTGPALKVTQTGNNSVAEFYDKESGVALFVGNGGSVGVGTNNPQSALHVNGTLTVNNPGWILHNSSGGNAVYDSQSKLWGSSIGGNGIYFDGVITINGANTNAWNYTTGVFTFPSAGLYLITINMFINGATAGRTGQINFASTIAPSTQYLPFEPNNLAGNNQRSFTMVKQCNANDTFYVQTESGSITLYLALKHTTFFINKIG